MKHLCLPHQHPVYRVKRSWDRFWAVFHLWHHINRLEQQIAWAHAKRLRGPEQHYRFLWTEGNIRLNNYMLRSPGLVRWAHRLYMCAQVCSTISADIWKQVFPQWKVTQYPRFDKKVQCPIV